MLLISVNGGMFCLRMMMLALKRCLVGYGMAAQIKALSLLIVDYGLFVPVVVKMSALCVVFIGTCCKNVCFI